MNYTREHMEAACCLWEAMLELRDELPKLHAEWLRHGTAVMRQHAIDLAVETDEEWSQIPDDVRDGMTFDWELCPMVIKRKWGGS